MLTAAYTKPQVYKRFYSILPKHKSLAVMWDLPRLNGVYCGL